MSPPASGTASSQPGAPGGGKSQPGTKKGGGRHQRSASALPGTPAPVSTAPTQPGAPFIAVSAPSPASRPNGKAGTRSVSQPSTPVSRSAPQSTRASLESTRRPGIPDSPLKQVNSEQQTAYLPKVVSLYRRLFTGAPHAPGFWVELFLLPVNEAELRKVLVADPSHFQREPGLSVVHTFVRAAIANMSPELPADIVTNALQGLRVLVTATLDLASAPTAKTASQPSALNGSGTTNSSGAPISPIAALTGLDQAATVFDDMTSRTLAILSSPNRRLVGTDVEFMRDIAQRLWGTSLCSLFTTKNFFAALIALVDEQTDDVVALHAFNLIGVLTALNVYDDDGAPVYRQRLSDYVDEAVMTKILALAQLTLAPPRPSAVETGVMQWMSNWFGSAPKVEETVPDDRINRLVLPLFLFSVYNPVFAAQIAASPALAALIETSVPPAEKVAGLGGGARSGPAAARSHTWLVLLLLRHLVDTEFAGLSSAAGLAVFRLATPKLALDTSRRMPLAGVLDFATLVLQTDPRGELGAAAADVVYQVCCQMVATKTIWEYNWLQLWHALVGVLKQLSTAAATPAAEAASTVPANSSYVVHQTLRILVGMSLRRDLLDEEDWHPLLLLIVQSGPLLQDLAARFPDTAQSAPVAAAKAMTAQHELHRAQPNPGPPNFNTLRKQGALAAGSSLIGEQLRPFSVTRQRALKAAIREQVKTE